MARIIRIFFLGSAVLLLAACEQLTTSAADKAELISATRVAADQYVSCVQNESGAYKNSGQDAVYVTDVIESKCKAVLESYADSERAYQLTQQMLTDEPVAEAVASLRATGRTVIAEEMLTGNSPSRGSTAITSEGGEVIATSVASGAGKGTPDAGAYMNCMSAQATRYMQVGEPADIVAEVAQSRCKQHLGSSNSAVLLQEGRALVLGIVLDAKASPGR